MEASRKIKMDAAQGAVVKNISQIEHGKYDFRFLFVHPEIVEAWGRGQKDNVPTVIRYPHHLPVI